MNNRREKKRRRINGFIREHFPHLLFSSRAFCVSSWPILFGAFLLWLLFSPTAFAEEPQVVARARVSPESGAWIGQAVILDVEVVTSTWFRGANDFPVVRIPGTVVVVPESFGGNFTEKVGRETYSGVRRRYLVYPQRQGAFEVPTLEVTATISGSDYQPARVTVKTKPTSFSVRRPEATEGVDAWVTTPRLTAEQHFDPPGKELKVGDAFRRTITVTADNTNSMMIPPMVFADADGMGVYPGTPELDDHSNRGSATASRVDTATYVMEAEGSFELPTITVPWWDPDNNRLHLETLLGRTIKVAANPDLKTETWASEEELIEKEIDDTPAPDVVFDREMIARLFGFAAGLIFVVWIMKRHLPRFFATVNAARHRYATSEGAGFKRLRMAARGGNAEETMRTLMVWLDRLAGDGMTPTLQRLLDNAADPILAEQIQALQSVLFSDQPSAAQWDPATFIRALTRARRKIRQPKNPQASGLGLKPLNPG